MGLPDFYMDILLYAKLHKTVLRLTLYIPGPPDEEVPLPGPPDHDALFPGPPDDEPLSPGPPDAPGPCGVPLYPDVFPAGAGATIVTLPLPGDNPSEVLPGVGDVLPGSGDVLPGSGDVLPGSGPSG